MTFRISTIFFVLIAFGLVPTPSMGDSEDFIVFIPAIVRKNNNTAIPSTFDIVKFDDCRLQ